MVLKFNKIREAAFTKWWVSDTGADELIKSTVTRAVIHRAFMAGYSARKVKQHSGKEE